MLTSVLVANRGEIAVRLIRACKGLGIRAVAVYSEADAGALHVRLADEAYLLGPAPAAQSYLNVDRILAVCRDAGVEGVHPGYGLLSENADFAAAVVGAGLVFVGPEPDTIARMGDKVVAREAAKSCEIPLLPGSDGPVDSLPAAERVAEEIGYPLVVKACFGGGGRGMRVVREARQLREALEQAERESSAAFGRGEVYLERYVPQARHVEVQVLADGQGGVIHLGDRDCSVQRRHQKLVEEAPAPALPEGVRRSLREAAVRLARSVGYRSAGTVEFLVDSRENHYYFLEMNTRLQVEHGVTELVTGVDLVEWQLKIAAGEVLDFDQDRVTIRGHAIQARIGAEDPWEGFRPCPGRIGALKLPLGPWLRLDFGVEGGDDIPAFYDAMFGKIQAWGQNREAARQRLVSALHDFEAPGVQSTAPYLRHVLEQSDFIEVRHHTGSVESSWQPEDIERPVMVSDAPPMPTGKPEDSISERRVSLSTSRGTLDIAVYGRIGHSRASEAATGAPAAKRQSDPERQAEPVAPMDSTVVKVPVAAGDRVSKGDTLVILEAMKMELQITAPWDSVVEDVLVEVGQTARRGARLVSLSGKEGNEVKPGS